jgi:hypothetical protein
MDMRVQYLKRSRLFHFEYYQAGIHLVDLLYILNHLGYNHQGRKVVCLRYNLYRSSDYRQDKWM